jgi:hypothetical protein
MTHETDLAWLAGMIEGDGSLGMGMHRSPKGNVVVKPFVNFSNQDIALVLAVKGLLEVLGGKTLKIGTVTSGYKKNRPVLRIDLKGMVAVLSVLTAIIPYLVGEKKQKAVDLSAFIHSRVSVVKGHNGSGPRPYSKKELNAILSFQGVTVGKGQRRSVITTEMLRNQMRLAN